MKISASLMIATALLQATLPPLRTLDRGSHSDIAEPRQAVARDAAAWEALWRDHAPGRARPAVDFGKEMVVGVFAGTKPTAGFAVEVVGTRDAASADVIVEYRETAPAPGTIVAQVLTAPHHLVAIARRAGNVTFRKIAAP